MRFTLSNLEALDRFTPRIEQLEPTAREAVCPECRLIVNRSIIVPFTNVCASCTEDIAAVARKATNS